MKKHSYIGLDVHKEKHLDRAGGGWAPRRSARAGERGLRLKVNSRVLVESNPKEANQQPLGQPPSLDSATGP